jgi:signal transduction histidine kinase
MRSLQAKLGMGLFLSLMAAFILLWIFISVSMRYVIEDYIYSRLAHDAETLLAAVSKNTETFTVDVARVGAVYQQPFSGHYFELARSGEILRSRSLWDVQLQYGKTTSTLVERQYGSGPQGQPLLILVSQFVKNDVPVQIVVAEDLSPIEAAISRFQNQFSITIVAILLSLVLLQVWLMRRGLRPIKQVQHDLGELEAGRIRSLQTDVPQELVPLVNEINHLHNALESRLARHRHALSDLAHALKKPLTVIQQLSTDERLRELPEISSILQRQSETTAQLIHRILTRAKLAGAAQTGRVFDFNEDLSNLLDTLQMMYRDKALRVTMQIPDQISTRMDAHDMLELLGNLLDNAFKWAKHEINISISQPDKLSIVIEDDGPGIPPESWATITQRGKRLDEQVEGHGMGLAIVGDIVDDYQGELNFKGSEALGGLRVTLLLPR